MYFPQGFGAISVSEKVEKCIATFYSPSNGCPPPPFSAHKQQARVHTHSTQHARHRAFITVTICLEIKLRSIIFTYSNYRSSRLSPTNILLATINFLIHRIYIVLFSPHHPRFFFFLSFNLFFQTRATTIIHYSSRVVRFSNIFCFFSPSPPPFLGLRSEISREHIWDRFYLVYK